MESESANKILFAEWFLGIKRKQIKYLEIGTASVLLLMLNIDMNPFLKCQISVYALVDVEIWVRNLWFDFKFLKFFTVSVHIFLFLIGRMWQNALKFISENIFMENVRCQFGSSKEEAMNKRQIPSWNAGTKFQDHEKSEDSKSLNVSLVWKGNWNSYNKCIKAPVGMQVQSSKNTKSLKTFKVKK